MEVRQMNAIESSRITEALNNLYKKYDRKMISRHLNNEYEEDVLTIMRLVSDLKETASSHAHQSSNP